MTPLGLSDVNPPYVETFLRSDGLYDWHLVSGNGEIVCHTVQGFRSRDDAAQAAARARSLFAETSEVRHAN